MKKILKTVVIAAMLTLLATNVFFPARSEVKSAHAAQSEIEVSDSGLNYEESAQNIINPERGIYYPLTKKIAVSGRTAWWDGDYLAKLMSDYGIFHLRLGLENFSTAAGGHDAEISSDALQALSATLEQVRRAGGTTIIRFSYNVDGIKQNGKYMAGEPSMELIEKHIAQLGEVISQYADILVCVETGMLGPWGEQHSTPLAQSGEQTFYRLVEAWLKAIPERRTVSVRRPLFYTYWANVKYGKELSQDNLSSDITVEGTDAYRVGVFNDGYLGSSSDLGTFKNRKEEVAWLSNQAQHTLYGGEVVKDSETGLIGEYNNVDYLENEAFITHTSYLNMLWNDSVINSWQNTAYDGKDPVYIGKTDFDYVSAHLGYRFVLRNSGLSVNNKRGGLLRLKGSIENVGFGNIVNKKSVKVLLVSSSGSYSAEVNWDARTLLSRKTHNYDWIFRLPSNMPGGKYEVYVSLRNPEEAENSVKRSIKFANNGLFNEKLGANKLGEITVSSETAESGHTKFEQTDGAQPKFVSVSFDISGGEGNIPGSVTIKENSYIALPECKATLKGYHFTGWSDGASVYAAGYNYRVSEENVTFSARWEIDVYTVRFLSREQATLVSGQSAQDVEYGGAAVPPVYEREGYKLVGWEGDYNNVTGHTAFYAVWEKEGEPQQSSSSSKNKGCSISIELPWGCLLPAVVAFIIKRKHIKC